MIIVETPIFTKLIQELMSDDEYKDFQEALVNQPDMGDRIREGSDSPLASLTPKTKKLKTILERW